MNTCRIVFSAFPPKRYIISLGCFPHLFSVHRSMHVMTSSIVAVDSMQISMARIFQTDKKCLTKLCKSVLAGKVMLNDREGATNLYEEFPAHLVHEVHVIQNENSRLNSQGMGSHFRYHLKPNLFVTWDGRPWHCSIS